MATLEQVVRVRSQAAEELCRLVEGELRTVLDDAERRMGKMLRDWEALRQLLVPVRVARGVRPRLKQVEYEDLERRRTRGDYRGLNELEKQRMDLRDEEAQQELKRETVEWEAVREEIGRAVVLGDPGYGKTTLLWAEVGRRNEAALKEIRGQQVATPRTRIAVFVRALEVAQDLGRTTPLVAALTARVARRRKLSAEAQEVLRKKLVDGDCLIALDALDEVPSSLRENLDAALAECDRQESRMTILLSSRLVGYTRSPITLDEEDELEILAFDETRMQRAVRAWFIGDHETGETFWKQIEAQPFVKPVLRCPLLLRLACQVTEEAKRKGKALGRWERKTDLYEAFLADAVTKWCERAEPRPTRTQRGRFLSFAGAMALELWKEDPRRTLWDPEVIAEVVERVAPDYAALAHREDLLEDLCVAGILVPAGADETNVPLMFTHRTLGEYLTAHALREQWRRAGEDERFVDRKAWDPAWEQVIVLLAGELAAQPEQLRELLRRLSDERTDDIFGHRLAVAAQCLAEIPTSLRSTLAVEIDHITTEAFVSWWEHQGWGTDKAIPHLSRALAALARVDGRVFEVRLLQFMSYLLCNPDENVRRVALAALSRFGSAAMTEEFLEYLQMLLREESHEARKQGADAVKALGSAAARSGIISRLGQLLLDPHSGVRQAALEALRSIGSESAIAQLMERGDYAVREDLGRIQRTAVGRGRQVAENLVAGARRLQQVVDELWGESKDQGPVTPEVLSSLDDMIRGPDFSLRTEAAIIAGSLDLREATPEVLAFVTGLLKDEDISVRIAGFSQVANLGLVAPEFLRHLSESLRSEDQYLRDWAANAVAVLSARGFRMFAAPEGQWGVAKLADLSSGGASGPLRRVD